jgi:GGDEF domain-containing protein
MTRGVESVSPRAGIERMRKMMREKRVRHLVVCAAGEQVLGVVSDRDLAAPRGRTAQDIMTAPVQTVSADMPLSPAITYMINRSISCLPVVNGGRLCGILTSVDVMLALQCALQGLLRVAQWLQSGAAQPSSDAPLADLRLDPATGLNNRRGLEETLELLLAIAARHRQPLTLAAVRIALPEDDTAATVERLATAAGALLENSRESDFAAHCGAGLFVVALAQTATDGAAAFCKRMAALLRERLPAAAAFETAFASAEPSDKPAAAIARAEAALTGTTTLAETTETRELAEAAAG